MPDGRRGQSIGERVRAKRIELGLSQRALSGPGVSYAYISRIEADERRPSVRALRQLASKLAVSATWLETGAEHPGVELARLILKHNGAPPPREAKKLARRALESS